VFYKGKLGPNIILFGQQNSGKSKYLETAILEEFIDCDTVIWLVGEPWSEKEMMVMGAKFKTVNKYLNYKHIADTKELNNFISTLEKFVQQYHDEGKKVCLIFDDLQAQLSLKPLQTVLSILQSWRHKNVTTAIVFQTFPSNIGTINILAHMSQVILFNLSVPGQMKNYLTHLPVNDPDWSSLTSQKKSRLAQKLYFDSIISQPPYQHLLIDNTHKNAMFRSLTLQNTEQTVYKFNGRENAFIRLTANRTNVQDNEKLFRINTRSEQQQSNNEEKQEELDYLKRYKQQNREHTEDSNGKDCSSDGGGQKSDGGQRKQESVSNTNQQRRRTNNQRRGAASTFNNREKPNSRKFRPY